MALDTVSRKLILSGLFATIFLDLVGFGMFIPLLPRVARELGGTPTEAALLSTLFSLGTLASSYFLGWLSDRVGRRRVLLGTIAFSAVMQGATGWVPNLAVLMVIRLLAGAAAGNISVAQACITDVTPPKERGKALVLIGLAFGGGFALGPALGALVARTAPEPAVLPTVALVAVALNVLNLVFVSRYLVETHPHFRPWKGQDVVGESNPSPRASMGVARGRSQWATVMGVQFLQVFGFVGLETLLPLLLAENYGFPSARVYDGFLVLGLLVLLANGVASRRVLGALGELNTLNLGQTLLAFGMVLLVVGIPYGPAAFGSLALVAFGTAFANPALGALVSQMAPPLRQGSAFGAAQTVSAVARILGPVTLGWLYEARGPTSLWTSAAVILVGCGLTVAVFRGRRSHEIGSHLGGSHSGPPSP